VNPAGTRGERISAGLLAALLGAALSGITILGAAEASNLHIAAHATRTLNVTDTAHLHEVKRPSSLIVEEGHAYGTLPGTVKASISLGATVIATVTIYPTGGGSITGHGSGELKGRPSEPSFGGHLTITAGTGRYAHAHGAGGLYGVLVRKTLSVTVSATGKLSY
jgi:hypothetical protein